jgi:folate-binding protein YgfZ
MNLTRLAPTTSMATETPIRAIHEESGATLAMWFGTLLPERYGDSATEYRQARESVALLDTNYRAFIELKGPDRVRYLNAIVSNDIQVVREGQGTVALLLNPQGHILAELECYALPDRLLVVSHALVRERTVQTLDKFIIMDDVTLVDATDRIGSVALEGPQAATIVKQLGGISLERMAERMHEEAMIGGLRCRVVRRSNFGEIGAEFLTSRDDLPALWRTLAEAARAQGGGPIGYTTFNALRLEAGVPWFSYDFNDKVIPQEAALETTHVSFSKGCYTGQEIVERVRSRGHVNRRRVGLEFSGQAIPAFATPLSVADREVGLVTSAALSPALGRIIGMGYVRSEANSVGSELEWAGGTAKVIELPIAAIRAVRSRSSGT